MITMHMISILTSYSNCNLTSDRREQDAARYGSDTDDTCSSFDVGGVGKFSHGVFNLVHQHWVMMLEALGGFNVSDTEGPEAYHKTCMRLTARRVRHLDTQDSTTHDSMRKYLLRHLLFTTLHDLVRPPPMDPITARQTGVKKPLRHLIDSHVRPVFMGQNLASVAMQSQILHEEVRIARVELMDLLCGVFSIRPCPASYSLLESLHWTFGHKLVTRDRTFWATDSEYATNAQKSGSRRDNFLMQDKVEMQVTLANGGKEERLTALCCQATCFISLGNMKQLQHLPLPHNVRKEIVNDMLTLVLVRWFEPHPTAIERDSRSMPLCPPPFHINHALWQFARTNTVRKCLRQPNGNPSALFERQRRMFGKSRAQQLKRLEDEAYAYYALVLPSNIDTVAHMFPEFERGSCKPTGNWLQTITFA